MNSIPWIDINLPYSEIESVDNVVFPIMPDTQEQERQKFGITEQEALAKMDYQIDVEAEIKSEYEKEFGPIEYPEDDTDEAIEAYHQMEKERLSTIIKIAEREWPRRYAEEFKNRRLIWAIREWVANLPEVKAIEDAYQAQQVQNEELEKTHTFAGRGLNKPGTQIELENGDVFLIGDINPNRGTCDDCTAFDSDDIVVRYRVLVPTATGDTTR